MDIPSQFHNTDALASGKYLLGTDYMKVWVSVLTQWEGEGNP